MAVKVELSIEEQKARGHYDCANCDGTGTTGERDPDGELRFDCKERCDEGEWWICRACGLDKLHYRDLDIDFVCGDCRAAQAAA